jgi:hypothetical protein
MQVFCRATDKDDAELHCCACGQGFVLSWEHASPGQRLAALPDIQEALRRHHLEAPGPQAHPADGFLVPDYSDSIDYFEKGLSSAPPSWAL